MPAFLLLLALLLLACDPTPPITPEAPPDGGQGGASSSSGVSSSVASSGSQGAGVGGSGGSGGGLSCDPCQDADGSRIVHRYRTQSTADGYRDVVKAGLLDTLRGEACSSLLAADGVLRCLPISQSPVFYYADSACSTPLFLVAIGGCEKVPLYIGEAVTLPGQCGTGTRVRKLAGEHVGDVHMLTGATCVKVTTPPPNLYAAGAEVTPSAFAVVEQVEAP